MLDFDLLVAGGGLAGLSAALVGARHGLRVGLVLDGVPGGPLVSVEEIEGLPGFPMGAPGYGLCPGLEEQASEAGVAFAFGTVEAVLPDGGAWRVAATDGDRTARAVILATGSRPKALGLRDEERYVGRGLSHCASCDGPLLRGRTAVVVGGGDAACQEALVLSRHAARVLLVHRGERLRARASYQQRLAATPAIEVRSERLVSELQGDARLEAVVLRHRVDGTTETVETGGLFVYIGAEPNSTAVAGVLGLAPGQAVPTDMWLRTRQVGLLAAGSVRADFPGQAVNAAADGTTAAIAAYRYLNGELWPTG